MVVTNKELNRVLLALTSAALTLPGIEAQADSPVAHAQGSTEYGHYQESDHRMQVDIYHVDGIVPINDKSEISFSLDRDTYSGASPAYSLPDNLVDQSYTPTSTSPVNVKAVADVISAASAITAATLAGGESGLQQSNNYINAYNDVSAQLSALYAGVSVPANFIENQAKLAGFSAATNAYTPANTRPVQRFQTQPLETRTQPVLGFKYYFDKTTLGITGGLSDEPDFISNFGAINFSHELNNKSTTLYGGYSVTRNAIFRNQGHSHSPSGIGLGHIHPADCAVSPCTDYARLDANSLFNGINLGFSQVLTKNTLFNLSANYTNQSGFLDNAYKTVYVRGLITPEEYVDLSNKNASDNVNWQAISPLEIVGAELFREHRPASRNIFSINSGLNQHIPSLDASVHFDYRFYHDDWQINSHTFELKWYQSLPFDLTVTPNIRYYSQSSAFFFAPYYLAPRADNYYSSDYRLASFGTLSGGITFSKKLAKTIKLNAGIDYYKHASSYALGGGGSGDYADYSYYLAHAGVDISFSGHGSLLEGEGNVFDALFNPSPHAHHQHHRHHDHGVMPPAGVMFGHTMQQADDVMVGYMYMNTLQSGNVLHGGQTVSDQAIVANACPGYTPKATLNNGFNGCLTKPTSMYMGMHMLDMMYAPTDWLNLMVMPQLMDMDMNMSSDLRSANYDKDGTYTEKHNQTDSQSFYSRMHHSVFDLGDTLLMPLFNLYDNGTHHIHIGTGMSAPTGNVAEVHNTLTAVQIAGNVYQANIKVLQDFGMQSGSGTWDFKPNLTYTGQHDEVFWGAQFNATKRLQSKNKSGYALGDIYQGTAWAGYKMFDWLSGTVRGVYTQQNKLVGDIYQLNTNALIAGQTNQIAHNLVSTTDYPQNSGGHYWDIGLGINLSVPSGQFAGHSLALEWLQPVKDVVNGYQLERSAGFAASWKYMF